MEDSALVVGAAAGNIGLAIEDQLASYVPVDAISITGPNHCLSAKDLEAYRYLVIACGASDIAPLHEQNTLQVERVIAANLTTPLDIIKNWIVGRRALTSAFEGLDPNSAREESACVVIGSYAHDHVLSNSTAYCAAKAGINSAIKSLAWDYTAKGFRFHCINPHSVEDTPMTEQVVAQIAVNKSLTTDEAMAYWRNTLLLPQRLTRQEVAQTVHWLLLDSPTPHLSGTSIELYGGER